MGSWRVGHDSATEQQQCTTFPNQVWVEDPREVQTSQWSSKVQSEKTKKTFKWFQIVQLTSKKLPLTVSSWVSESVCVRVCARAHTLNCVRLFMTPLPIALRAPQSVEFSRQVVISYSRGSTRLRDWTHISCIGRRIHYHCVTWEAWVSENSHNHPKMYCISNLMWQY